MAMFGANLSVESPWNWIASIVFPVLAMAIWGILAVPNDKSRSSKAPVPISGVLRLVLEFGFFGFATWCFFSVDLAMWGSAFGVLVLLHYAVSLDRLKWLMNKKPTS